MPLSAAAVCLLGSHSYALLLTESAPNLTFPNLGFTNPSCKILSQQHVNEYLLGW